MTHAASPRIAIYPGTFDPITRGHSDLVARASPLFERIVVGVADSSSKGPGFPLDERLELARLALASAVRQVLANGLALLGVSAPQTM